MRVRGQSRQPMPCNPRRNGVCSVAWPNRRTPRAAAGRATGLRPHASTKQRCAQCKAVGRSQRLPSLSRRLPSNLRTLICRQEVGPACPHRRETEHVYPRDLGVPDKEPIIEAAAQLTGPHDYGPWKTMDQSTLGNKGQPLWLKTNASVKRGAFHHFPDKADGWASKTFALSHTDGGQFIQEVQALHFSGDQFPYVRGAEISQNSEKGDKSKKYCVLSLYGGSGAQKALSNGGGNFFAFVVSYDPDNPKPAAREYTSVPIGRTCKWSPTGLQTIPKFYSYLQKEYTVDKKFEILQTRHFDRLSQIATRKDVKVPPPPKTSPKRESPRSGAKRSGNSITSNMSSKRTKPNQRRDDVFDEEGGLDDNDAQDDELCTRSQFDAAFNSNDVGSMKITFDIVRKELDERDTAVSNAQDEVEKFKNAADAAQAALAELKKKRAPKKKSGGGFTRAQMDAAVAEAVAKLPTKPKSDVGNSVGLRTSQLQVKGLESENQKLNFTLAQAQAQASERSDTITQLKTQLTQQQAASIDALLKQTQTTQQEYLQAIQGASGAMAVAMMGSQAIQNKMPSLPSVGGMGALLFPSSSGASPDQPPTSLPPPPVAPLPPVDPKFCGGCGHNFNGKPEKFCKECGAKSG